MPGRLGYFKKTLIQTKNIYKYYMKLFRPGWGLLKQWVPVASTHRGQKESGLQQTWATCEMAAATTTRTATCNKLFLSLPLSARCVRLCDVFFFHSRGSLRIGIRVFWPRYEAAAAIIIKYAIVNLAGIWHRWNMLEKARRTSDMWNFWQGRHLLTPPASLFSVSCATFFAYPELRTT